MRGENSFPKSARLLKPNQFRTLCKYGRQSSGKHIALQMRDTRRSSLKLGITVSRKFGKAVKRNRFKRLVREAFRLSQNKLPRSLDLNVRPLAKFNSELSLKSIQEELITLTSGV